MSVCQGPTVRSSVETKDVDSSGAVFGSGNSLANTVHGCLGGSDIRSSGRFAFQVGLSRLCNA